MKIWRAKIKIDCYRCFTNLDILHCQNSFAWAHPGSHLASHGPAAPGKDGAHEAPHRLLLRKDQGEVIK